MTPERKGRVLDKAWLTEVLVGLLDKASEAEEPDHQACGTYAKLLYGMLPEGRRSAHFDEALETIRREVMEKKYGA